MSLKKILYILIAIIFIISCKSVPKETEPIQQEQTSDLIPETQTKTEPISTKPEIEVSTTEQKLQEKPVLEETPKQIKIDNSKYEEMISSVVFTKISSPSTITKGSIFKEPFVISVTDKATNNPCIDFKVAIKYPIEKNQETGELFFDVVYKKTDKFGKLSFTPSAPIIATDSEIVFYAEPELKDSDSMNTITEIINKYALKLPYKVKTNLCAKGGSIALLDFDSNGRLITNTSISSSALLMALYKVGFSNVGNSPDISSAILTSDMQKVFIASKKIQPRNAYIVYGFVRYEKPAEKDESGKTVLTLNAEIICYNMTENKPFFTKDIKVTATGINESSALDEARKNLLAPQIADLMIYGM